MNELGTRKGSPFFCAARVAPNVRSIRPDPRRETGQVNQPADRLAAPSRRALAYLTLWLYLRAVRLPVDRLVREDGGSR